MATFGLPKFISYDLRKPGRNYNELLGYLRRLGAIPCTESGWLLDDNLSPIELRDRLKQYMDANDAICVVPLAIGAGWATDGLDSAAVSWLRRNLSR